MVIASYGNNRHEGSHVDPWQDIGGGTWVRCSASHPFYIHRERHEFLVK